MLMTQPAQNMIFERVAIGVVSMIHFSKMWVRYEYGDAAETLSEVSHGSNTDETRNGEKVEGETDPYFNVLSVFDLCFIRG